MQPPTDDEAILIARALATARRAEEAWHEDGLEHVGPCSD